MIGKSSTHSFQLVFDMKNTNYKTIQDNVVSSWSTTQQ